TNIKGIGGSNMLTYSNMKPKTDNKTLVEANTSGRGPRNITPFGWGNEVDLRQQRMIYDRLLWPTASGTDFQNRLATSVSYKDDTTLEIDLREGHKWHDGSEVLAEDVKFSYDTNMPDSDYSTPLGGSLDPVTEVTVDDDYRITINLEYAWAPVKLALMSRVPIAQKKHWEELFQSSDFKGRQSTLGNYNPQSRVGSGPMTFESWDTASGEVRLKKNPDHFDPIQYDARISKGISGVQQALSQLKQGQTDIISEYTGDLNVLDKVAGNSDAIEVARTEACVPYWNVLNCDYPPANIEEFRNASMYCWSPQEIIDTVWNGHGRAGHKHMISPVLNYWFNDNLEQYSTDLQAAANELINGGFVWDKENGDLYMPADHYCLTQEEAQPALDADLDRDMVMCD
ncbi:MAG: ABC transporter substrate-binding protein, partial [Haloglomus sp.]